jgi:hypothetical protein
MHAGLASEDGSSSAHFHQHDFNGVSIFGVFFFGFWGSFYCLAAAIFCFVFVFKLIDLRF